MPGTGSAHAHDDPSLLGGRTDGREGVVVRMSCARGEAGRGGRALCRRLRGHLTCRAPPRKTLFNCSSLPVSCCCCLPSNLDKRCSCTAVRMDQDTDPNGWKLLPVTPVGPYLSSTWHYYTVYYYYSFTE